MKIKIANQKVTRRQRRAMPRTGIKIEVYKDRGQQIIDNPDDYFTKARARAREQIERDSKLADAK